ncbi:glycosyltransferase family 39 protein [Lysobacter sp. LF1]|uniref:Glycosyltransferase family 39 protein n=1 Tax=Lysobacter stagni TaxID=3045172 RepID=A0ABT6XF06_9GAMM|nr:glycosyltransferase family 39 protein [Lysobacter sp. LF1]MDI9238734.1 glycosyltransferase family 39 protein [Lysobacter sp. LF1]
MERRLIRSREAFGPGRLRAAMTWLEHPSVAALALLLTFLAFGAFWALNADPLRGDAVMATSVRATGFVPEGRDGFKAVESSVSRVLEGHIPVAADHGYVYSFTVRPVDSAAVALTVDLFGPGYDSPRQEQNLTVLGGPAPVELRGVIESGDEVPPDVSFRILHSGPPGVVIENIRIGRLNAWRLWGQHLATIALIVATLWSAWLFGGWVVRGEERQPARVATPVVALGLIFVASVALRFCVSLALPYWSGDEYVYKAIAMGLWQGGKEGIPLSDQIQHATNLPNMLYPYLIAPAFAMGESFYTGIRFINAVLVSSAVFPAYAIARRFLPLRASLVVAAASVVLPAVFISAYAVTEVLYFPLFLLCVAVGLSSLERPEAWGRAATLGLLVGALLNVRLNGIILLPAYLISLALVMRASSRGRMVALAKSAAAMLASMLVAYLAIRSLISISGTAGLGMYENHSGGWLSSAWSAAISDPRGVWKLLLGHLTILAFPFALGIATLMAMIAMPVGNSEESTRWRLHMFLLLAAAGAVAMALVFTLGVSKVDLGGLGRWHSRYYFSVFPLLLVACMAPLDRARVGGPGRWLYWLTLGVFLLAPVLFVVVHKFSADPWFGATVDSMEAHWYRAHARWLVVLAVGALLAAYLKLNRSQSAAALAVIGVWLLLANYGTWRELRDRSPGASDSHCGAVAAELLSRNPGPVAVVVSGRKGLVDNVFWLPAFPVTTRMVDANSELSAHQLANARYILADSGVTIRDATRVSGTGLCRIYKVSEHER